MTDLCSAASRERQEPLTATASRVERWLLVEHRGAWGPETVPSGRMPVNVARFLARTAAAAQARLLLVRRPAGLPRTDGRWVYAVDSRPGGEQVLARHVEHDADLLGLTPPYATHDADLLDPTPSYGRHDADLLDLTQSYAAGWDRFDGPLYLVCTHGRHDRCCALRGRPVAKALSLRFPERTWESTHVGGDRFAANLVVLPEGLYLGRIEADEALRVVDDLADGLLPAGRVRGRSSLPLPVQAAQQLAREASGRWGVTDLAPLSQVTAGADVWTVRLAGPGGPDVEVVVAYDRSGGGQERLTCDAEEDKPVPLFRQVSLRTR